MDADMVVNGPWGLVALLVTTISSIMIAKITNKSGKKANDESEQLEKDAVVVDDFVSLLAEYRQDHAEYRERLEQLEKLYREARVEIDDLTQWKRDMSTRYRSAIKYILELRKHAQRHAPNATLPTPPDALLIDLEEPLP